MKRQTLYHFTCDHGTREIRASGILRPIQCEQTEASNRLREGESQ